jgi:hypothetical protein
MLAMGLTVEQGELYIAWEPMSRGSASAQTMEAEPPDMRYQALPGNEYNHLGLR